MVQEAVDGYEEYLRHLIVAQGLSDADYPPGQPTGLERDRAAASADPGGRPDRRRAGQ
jgi:hypothetical protein